MYNPYAGISLKNQKDLSFHLSAHHMADVLLNGRLRINLKFNDSIVYAPNNMDISNFQFMHQFADARGDLLNIYRHGYGFTNDQQLCIGARKVIWTEYPVIQNLRHKQDIIEKLHRTSRLIALSDPFLSYTANDLKYLSGYHLMELTNTQADALNSWDIALSNGHRIYLMLTNLEFRGLKLYEQMLHFNHVLAKSDSLDAFVQALDEGTFYSISFPESLKNTLSVLLKSAVVERDTFFVEVEPFAASFRFIGQDGKQLQISDSTIKAAYPIRKEDTYIRTEITFDDGTIMFLNPISRQEEQNQERQKLSEFNSTHTALMRGVYIVLIMILLQLFYRWQIKKLKSK